MEALRASCLGSPLPPPAPLRHAAAPGARATPQPHVLEAGPCWGLPRLPHALPVLPKQTPLSGGLQAWTRVFDQHLHPALHDQLISLSGGC